MKKLMVVDDNRNIRRFCRRELEKEGYRVVVAASGKEALAILLRWRPALVILDGRLRDRGGLELLGEIASLHAGLPVILYTEHADCAADPRARGARAVVPKTEDLSELKQTIVQVLGQRPAGKARHLAPSRN